MALTGACILANTEKALRVLCILLGVVLSIVGCVVMNKSSEFANSNVVLQQGCIGFYSFFMGFFTVVAELRSDKIRRVFLKYFMFLDTFLGRALFYVFVGIVVLPLQIGQAQYAGQAMGGLYLAAGTFNLLLFPMVCRKKKTPPAKEGQMLADAASVEAGPTSEHQALASSSSV